MTAFMRVVAALILTLDAAVSVMAEPPVADPVVTLAIAGDIMFADTPGEVVARGDDPFAHLASVLDGADLRVGNLECVIATGGESDPDKPWSFRADPRVLAPLRAHFDGVTLANNHSGDFGPTALAETLGLLDQAGLGRFGGGADLAEAHRPWVVERKGLRIAFLGYDEFLPRSFEADYDRPGVAWSEDAQVMRDIRAARVVHGADLVIPVMHWGFEGEIRASERQRRLARLMIDAGADAVIGGHPHVIQDTDAYRGRPIVYSLGNFVFDGFSQAINNTGWLVTLNLDRDGVRSLRTHSARIDGEGIPHPDPGAVETCWERGQVVPGRCGASGAPPKPGSDAPGGETWETLRSVNVSRGSPDD
jgi:hypothetical protein